MSVQLRLLSLPTSLVGFRVVPVVRGPLSAPAFAANGKISGRVRDLGVVRRYGRIQIER